MNVCVFYPCHLQTHSAPVSPLESLQKKSGVSPLKPDTQHGNNLSQGCALGTTTGVGLFKWGHMQEQRGLLGNKRSGIKLETNGVALLMEMVKSSSVEPAKGVEVEPKFTCACSSSSTQYPAMKR